MKEIDIRDQHVLSAKRTFRLTVNGIRYRLFRSAVTVVVVSVAVAFMMNIVSESLIKKAVAVRTGERLRELQLATSWASRLRQPGTVGTILREIAGGSLEDDICREAAGMAQLSAPEMQSFHQQCREAEAYLAFFDGLDYARRRRLIQHARGTAIFDHLTEPANMQRFERELAVSKSLRLPGEAGGLAALLASWPRLNQRLENLRAARAAAIAKINAELDGAPVLEALTTADGGFGKRLRDAGFVLPRAISVEVAGQARRQLQQRAIEQSLLSVSVKRDLAAHLDLLPRNVTMDMLWKLLGSAEGAAWYLGCLQANDLPPPATAEELAQVARQKRRAEALFAADRVGGEVTGGLLRLGERMSWLVLVSMIVCTVGIANAMLMSVTERFREIATLKCLGALDSIIMLMFVFEAGMLGIVGGLCGTSVGSLIGLGRMFARYGTLLGSSIPFADLLIAGVVTTIVGIVLAVVASVYPSLKAARLAPMEAMRIE